MKLKEAALAIASIFLAGSLLSSSSTQFLTPAYGHGLGMDETMVASIGDRQIMIRTDMIPSTLFAGTPQEALFKIRFLDKVTDTNILHVTFFLKVTRAGETVLMDWFHTHDGHFAMNIRPTTDKTFTVYAPKEPILDGWIGNLDAPALAQGPIFTEGGMHTIDIEIFSIDTDKTLLDPTIKAQAYVSVGEATTYSVISGGAEEVIEVRTYFDKIQDFGFDQANKVVRFTMPMNWEKDFISQIPFLHEEILIPRSMSSLAVERYTGTLNGVTLPPETIMVDFDSDPEKVIVHFMLTGKHLLQISEQVATSGGSHIAEFTLAPAAGAPSPLPPAMGTMPSMMDVSVNMKQTKKATLVAVKSSEDSPIYGVQLKVTDGKVRFVKARGWDRDRVDQSTVLVFTQDQPLLPGKPMIIILLSDNPSSSVEWSVLGKDGSVLGGGAGTPKAR